MKMATVIREVFVLVGFVLASTIANAQEESSSETPQFEQLQAEESAAAVVAAKIRELKASGIELDSDRLIELDRNLKTHLDAAFDLKLQIEERQVKTLQTRLSQLESQISQRKQLRDKIISRRAAELIDDEALDWSSQDVVVSDVSEKLAEVPVAISSDSEQSAMDRGWEILGLRLESLSDEDRTEISNKAYLGTQKPVRYKGGMRVVSVRTGSVAEAFIQVGDILLGLDGFETLESANISYILRDARLSNAAPMKCLFLRKGWNPIENTLSVSNTKSPIEELRTPEQFQADLEPLLQNVKICEQRLREQEAAYYNDNSNAAELQAAWDALMLAEADLKKGAVPIEDAIRVVREQHSIARETLLALHKQQVLKLSLLAKGEATEAEVEAARKACVSFGDSVETFTARLHLLSNLLKSIPQRRDHEKYFRGCTSAKELSPSIDNHDPVDALIWLEAGFNAKLEFVKFDNLNLPIKAALRVCESTDKYQPDDLIIAIKGYSFETFDEAVTAALSDGRFVPSLLRGGLLGDVYPGNFDGQLRYLRNSGGSDVTFNLEVPLVAPESGETRIRYLQGICVSLEGLAVVPSLITSIEEGKSIKIFGTTRGTASVVAIDEVHKLTLLKLDIPDKKLFTWVKCLTSMPSKGQRLSVLYEFAPPNSYSQSISATVLAINQDYSLLPDCHDAFTLNEIANVPFGAMLRSIDHELQGILLEKSRSAPEAEKITPHACLPAVHIEALRAKYRASHADHR